MQFINLNRVKYGLDHWTLGLFVLAFADCWFKLWRYTIPVDVLGEYFKLPFPPSLAP